MEWIKVNISKPESFYSVLGYFMFNERFIDVVCYNPDTDKWMASLITIKGKETIMDDEEVNVTHWMPLPEPPISGEETNGQ